MKILFLDFDGVIFTVGGCIHARLQSGKERAPKWELDPVSLSLIRQLLKDNKDIRIVVSSVWRLGNSITALKKILGPGVGCRVIGKTPATRKGYRGAEIKMWLDANKSLPIDDILIIDDDSDMNPYMGYLFHTDSYDGLKYSDLSKIEWYLKQSEWAKKKIRVKKVLWMFLRHTYYGWIYKFRSLGWKLKRRFK